MKVIMPICNYQKSLLFEIQAPEMIKLRSFAVVKKIAFVGEAPLPFTRPQIESLKTLMQVECLQLWQFAQFIYYCFIRPNELRQILLEDLNFLTVR